MFNFGVWKGINIKEEIKKSFFRDFIFKFLHFLLGVISSQGVILGRYNPFGVSMAIAVNKTYTFPATLGAILGYLFLHKLSKGIGYISVILMINTFIWIFDAVLKEKYKCLFLSVVCFISSLSVGVFVNYPGDFNFFFIYSVFLESLVMAISIYFFKKTFDILTLSIDDIPEKQKIIYLFVSLFILLISLSSIVIFKVSLSRVLSVFIIILSSCIQGVYGGSIMGIATGTAVTISSFGTPYILGVYALSGLVSGFFSKLGKLASCFSFAFCSIIFLLNSAILPNVLTSLFYEIAIGIFIFLLTPKEFISYISLLFSTNNKYFCDIESKNFNSADKGYISKTIRSMSNIAENTIYSMFSGSMSEIENTCMDSVYRVCRKCNLKSLCWEQEIDQTTEIFENIISDILSRSNTELINYNIEKRCKNSKKVIENIKKAKSNYEASVEAKRRIKELCRVMSEKVSFAKALFDYASEGFRSKEILEKSRKIKNLLSKYNIETVRTECRVSDIDRIFVEIEVMKISDKTIIKDEILRKISIICGKKMSEPVVFDLENRTIIRISQKEILDLNVNISRHSCNNGEFCGDFCCHFKDGTGKFSIIISDGMGTGGRAAADGALTARIIERLIKLRVEPISAVKIANLSILGKTSEESFAAIDIMTFDLYSGFTKFTKAGAPITFFRKDGKVNKIETTSLPIGIFDEANISVNKNIFSEGDLIVMMSDGVTDVGTEWVESIIKNIKQEEIENLSDLILQETLRRRGTGRDDDITVAVINILKV